MPLPTSLVVKNGSKIWPILSGSMPEPVSDRDTATKSPAPPACPRRAGIWEAASTRTVSVPSPSMASRAFTAMLTRAVSNCATSASTKQRSAVASVTIRMREPTMVRTISLTARTRSAMSNSSGLSACRRAKARSWPVNLEARSTVSVVASM